MKKYSYKQIALVAIISLTVGLITGLLYLNWWHFVEGVGKSVTGEEYYLRGSIDKIERYRNIKVTEKDIILRNELLGDTLMKKKYQNTLTFYYYYAVKTSLDVETVLKKMDNSADFFRVYYPYNAALLSYKDYLVNAREDILLALQLLVTLDSSANLPVIEYLNLARNAIARINNHQSILTNYMYALTTYLHATPGQKYPELEEAHDIISLNLMQAALITQNMPMVTYLQKQKLYNQQEKFGNKTEYTMLKTRLLNYYHNDIDAMGINQAENLEYRIGSKIEMLLTFYATNLLKVVNGDETVLKELVCDSDRLGLL